MFFATPARAERPIVELCLSAEYGALTILPRTIKSAGV